MAVMREGVIEQVDRPTVVYERPVSTFVAQFVGSPTMNLIPPGTVPFLERLLGDRTGRDVTCGVRPHDLALVSPSEADVGSCGRVEMVEPLGGTSIVHVALPVRQGLTLRAVVPGDAGIAIDDQVGVRFRPDRIHWFESGSGRRLD
jgi:ABC-type sugar transport system ATPase subunit